MAKEARFKDVVPLGADQDGRMLVTINDVIHVNNDQVWNCFINQARIHQTILCEDKKWADRLTHDNRVPLSFNGTVWEGLDGDSVQMQGQVQRGSDHY